MSRLADTFNQAWQYHQANDFQRAEQLYREILRADPRHADAWCFLGAICHAQGRLTEAEQNLRRALQYVPDYPTAQNLLGIVLAQQGRLEEGAISFRQLLSRHPDDAEANSNMGNLLTQQGKYDEAIFHCRRSLLVNQHNPAAHNNLGNALRQKGKQDEAIASFDEALRLNPSFVEAHLNMGAARHGQLRFAEAEAHYREALRLRPSNKLRVLLASLMPPVFSSLAELQERRQKLIDDIGRLRKEGVVVDLATDEPTIDTPALFYLPYQGLNDIDIQRDFAKLFRPLQMPVVPSRPPGGKIKIGFLSRFFKNHTIGRLMRGLIANLSREIFEVTVLSIGQYQDSLAQAFQQSADHFVVLPANYPAAAQLVAKQQLDVLFFTDLGMEAISLSLAHTRLAPVQCATWGHPITSGMPTIDYFISSATLEADVREPHYTETLIRLKTLPIHYYRPEPPTPLKDRQHFGLSNSDHVYACPQSLFKFHPDFDEVLASILHADPLGKLVLLQGLNPTWVEMLRQRFAKAMPECLSRVHFLAFLEVPEFINLLAVSDVLLDPLHFGGGNTSYEGLAVGTPIVTLPSEFLRGRITWTLYHQMGVKDCVAKNPADYVNKALKLGTDADCRANMRQKILAANGVLFENSAGIRELEGFLQRAVTAAAAGKKVTS